jgi:glycosyltransferase involved in cell wall biosynthesis
MRVALFLGRNAPNHSGGTYSFERQLLSALSEFKDPSGHEFFVFGWSSEIPSEILSASHIHFVGKLKDSKASFRFKFSRLAFKKIFKNSRDITLVIKLKNFIKRFILGNNSNILKQISAYKIEIAWSLGLDCPTMDIPYIATVWDLQHRVQPYYPEVSRYGEWGVREAFYSEMLRRATFVVTGTRAGKDEIERCFNVAPDKIKIIPFATPNFALNASSCNENNREKMFVKYEIFKDYLFYPAQFWPHKNHVGLLLALKYLKENLKLTFSVVFAGSDKGNLEFVKQKADEFGLSDQVRFIGFIPCDDLVLLYQNAFALTYVTFAGPDNLPPLEAFALGCPVIASRVSGAEEQLGDAAILVNPSSPQEIALAIKSLKENSDLRLDYIQRGLSRAKQWVGQDYIREICSILDEFTPIRRCWSTDDFI